MLSFADKIEIIKAASAIKVKKQKAPKRPKQPKPPVLSSEDLMQVAAAVYAPWRVVRQAYFDANAMKAIMNSSKILRNV